MQIQIVKKIEQAIKKTTRVLCVYGGRGSGKSETIARILAYEGSLSTHRILCCREFQNSIADSVHSLLKDVIELYEIPGYTITDKYIRHENGTEFLFKGLKKESMGSVKSLNKITICWVEEAQYISRTSLDILMPTIREAGSKIFFTLNPTNNEDPVYVDFVLKDRPDTVKCLANWTDNKWFTDELRLLMDQDYENDYDKYLHIWEGQCVVHSEAQIFYKKWEIDDVETPERAEWNLGLDFGFSVDPNACIASYVVGNTLYIRHEAYDLHTEIDKMPAFLDAIPVIRQAVIIADSARPETISYLRNRGYNIRGAKKGKGSIEDGIELIRGFDKVFIHPSCKHTIEEFQNYKWKTDPKTDEIFTVPEDKNNHIIDALRYSLEGLGRSKLSIIKYGGNNGINKNNMGFRR